MGCDWKTLTSPQTTNLQVFKYHYKKFNMIMKCNTPMCVCDINVWSYNRYNDEAIKGVAVQGVSIGVVGCLLLMVCVHAQL